MGAGLAARFLVLPGPHEAAARETLDSLARAHGGGGARWDWDTLPCVTVDYEPGEAMWGRYLPPGGEFGLVGKWRGPVIHVAADCPVPRLTFAHEFAHLLDHACAGFSPYSMLWMPSEHSGTVFGGVVRAAQRTASVRERDSRLGGALLPGKKEKAEVYRLRRAEVWSEAYAQWAAVRSGDPMMLAEVAHLRLHAPDEVWPDDDFAPVAAELDRLMSLGSAVLMPRQTRGR